VDREQDGEVFGLADEIGGNMDGFAAVGVVVVWTMSLAGLLLVGYCAFVGAEEIRRRAEMGKRSMERLEQLSRMEP